MTLADIKDYLKANIECDQWYVGKRDMNKEESITVYPTTPAASRIPVGGIINTSYAVKAASVLIHWGQSATPAELKAKEVYDLLYGQQPIIGQKQVIKIDLRTAEPVGMGTDAKGFFEYIINFLIYYKK